MSMDLTYQTLHHLADDLHYRVKDTLDEPDHPTARALHDELKELISDFELQKKPRNIEERLKVILDLLEQARGGSQTYMSVGDAVTFHKEFEEMRREVKGHPDYA